MAALRMAHLVGVHRTTQVVFDIRNGQPADAVPIFNYGSTPSPMHWVHIQGMDRALALANTELYAAAAYAQLHVAADYAPHGGAPLDANGYTLHARIVGGLRAAMVAFYDIGIADVQVDEVVTDMLTFTIVPPAPRAAGAPAAPAAAPTYTVAFGASATVARPNAQAAPLQAVAAPLVPTITAALAAPAGGGAPPAMPAIPAELSHLGPAEIVRLGSLPPTSFAAWFLSYRPMDADERSIVTYLHRMGAALPVYQGYNLCMTDHHHLSRTGTAALPALAAGMYGEYFGSATGPAPFSDVGVQDTIFHKAAHVLRIPFKMNLAGLDRIAEIMKVSLNRALAARLPFRPTELRVAETYQLVLRDAATFIQQYGGSVDAGNFPTIVEYARAVDKAARAGLPAPAMAPPDTVAVLGVAMSPNNAAEVLGLALSKIAPAVAFAFGVYATATQRALTLTGVANNPRLGARGANTIINAYSLLKLVGQQTASFNQGASFAAAAERVTDRMARQQRLIQPNLSFASGVQTTTPTA